jgi:hypothetical protein
MQKQFESASSAASSINLMASTTIDFLNANTGAIQALSTIVLVLITLYYAIQTRQAVKEAANTRKDTRLPIIRVGISGPIGTMTGEGMKQYLSIRLKNVGYGIARHISVSLPLLESQVVRSLDSELEAQLMFFLKEGDLEKLNDLSENERLISVEYKDIFSRKVSTIAAFEDTKEHDWTKFEVKRWDPILPE